MATIKTHTDSGELFLFKPNLRADQQQCRLLYFSKRSKEWVHRSLPSATTDGFTHGAMTPLQQFDTLTRRYCAGEDLTDPPPHPMKPESDGIWRLKTADLRIVGWFVKQAVFVTSEIDLKPHCHARRDEELLENARQYRSQLNIDDGAFVEGDLNDCL